MVPGARILLILLAVLGCEAERLGVVVPRGGREAISMEDLQRDALALSGAPAPARAAHVQQRLQQMHLLPAFGDGWSLPLGDGRAVVCGQRDGRSERAILVVAAPPSGPPGAEAAPDRVLPAAALISLAKAWDVPAPPAHTLVFCVAPAPGGLEAYARQPAVPLGQTDVVVHLGPLSEATPGAGPGASLGGEVPVRSLLKSPASAASGAPPPHGLDAIDYLRVAEQVREAADQVASLDREESLQAD